VNGDPVLLEWAIESLAKNAIDALAGRDGQVDMSATALPEGRVRVRVADTGPGVPRELGRRIFEPGFSTKDHGWESACRWPVELLETITAASCCLPRPNAERRSTLS
jgi:K+-sensing histidine kinase KdpD